MLSVNQLQRVCFLSRSIPRSQISQINKSTTQIINNYTKAHLLEPGKPVSVKLTNFYSTDKPQNSNQTLSTRQKLQKAISEYGSTVIVFHVSISLVSLGVFYLLVSSGLDVGRVINALGVSSEMSSKLLSNAGTFAMAYAVHKIFAPARIMVTLTATPFIVRYLRGIGFLKK